MKASSISCTEKKVDGNAVLCPRCNVIFDNLAAKLFEGSKIQKHYSETLRQQQREEDVALKAQTPAQIPIQNPAQALVFVLQRHTPPKPVPPRTFVPSAKAPQDKWLRVNRSTNQHKPQWRAFEFGRPKPFQKETVALERSSRHNKRSWSQQRNYQKEKQD